MKGYILALDQGTTSSRAVLFDEEGRMVCMVNEEFRQIYPRPGWVEQDPEDIWSSQIQVARKVLEKAGVTADRIVALGITNQRETTIVWDRRTGKPVYNAIVWQCRRTTQMCEELRRDHEELIREKTGLVVDAYFSATKLKWILDNVEGAREEAKKGDLLFGTVDTWLLWRLTGGKVHATDCSNASRTMLFNIHKLNWDDELLELFDVPKRMLPEVLPTSATFGFTEKGFFGREIPIASVVGDQQAALFGQACFQPGMVKNTYGTGCFILMNTGKKAFPTKTGLLTTVAWKIGDDVFYALEGSVFIAGAAVKWLRDGLGLIKDARETEELAKSVPDNGGVYFVPAFVGLGAPYWDMRARGLIIGLTQGVTKEHIVRAVLEAIAYQNRDVLDVMELETNIPIVTLRVDGGASVNNFLMQFQADVLGIPVERPLVSETTALGAAFLAGLAVGYWGSLEELQGLWKLDKRFEPSMEESERERLYSTWKEAVRRSLRWVG